MSFMPSRTMRSRPSQKGTVWAVGRRVYVNCTGPEHRGVGLSETPEDSSPRVTSLADGIEVEIRAWRPRGAAGTRYCVSACAEGVSGWLGSDHLRATRVAPPPVPRVDEAPAAPMRPFVGRRFGEGR